MRSLLAPFSERVGARMAASPVAPVGRRIAGAELGFLLGYVAQRVLGQYDLLVPEDSSTAHLPTTPCTTSGRTCSGSRSASRSGRATSGSGSRSTS